MEDSEGSPGRVSVSEELQVGFSKRPHPHPLYWLGNRRGPPRVFKEHCHTYTEDELLENLMETAIPLYVELKRKGKL